MPLFKDLTGQRFGKLVAIKRSNKNARNLVWWECKCECGNIKVVSGQELRMGTKSCGCLKRVAKPKSEIREYGIWAGMIQRCNNKNSNNYHKYGGKGILVCSRWLVFENFIADMGNAPSQNHTLDRINNNGNYEPTNCRWATWTEQLNNTSRNKFYEYNGERLSVAQWAKRYNIGEQTLRSRLLTGRYNIEESLYKNPHTRKRRTKRELEAANYVSKSKRST